MRVLRDYFFDRILIYDTTAGPGRMQIKSGTDQGSILGPELWNISYDDILKIEMSDNAHHSGYADDTVLLIPARTTE